MVRKDATLKGVLSVAVVTAIVGEVVHRTADAVLQDTQVKPDSSAMLCALWDNVLKADAKGAEALLSRHTKKRLRQYTLNVTCRQLAGAEPKPAVGRYLEQEKSLLRILALLELVSAMLAISANGTLVLARERKSDIEYWLQLLSGLLKREWPLDTRRIEQAMRAKRALEELWSCATAPRHHAAVVLEQFWLDGNDDGSFMLSGQLRNPGSEARPMAALYVEYSGQKHRLVWPNGVYIGPCERVQFCTTLPAVPGDAPKHVRLAVTVQDVVAAFGADERFPGVAPEGAVVSLRPEIRFS